MCTVFHKLLEILARVNKASIQQSGKEVNKAAITEQVPIKG
ncbi:hypothetical protein [Streptococcus acidominimus]|nr:hypothetical protein [Streptococcus acidominimus]